MEIDDLLRGRTVCFVQESKKRCRPDKEYAAPHKDRVEIEKNTKSNRGKRESSTIDHLKAASVRLSGHNCAEKKKSRRNAKSRRVQPMVRDTPSGAS